MAGIRDRFAGSADASSGGAAGARPRLPPSYPYWRSVATFRGGPGNSIHGFDIARAATLWRAVWQCNGSGVFAVTEGGTSAALNPLIRDACNGGGTAFSTDAGPRRLVVSSTAEWTIDVDQQLTAPLAEPPTPMMLAAGTSVAAKGTVRGVDKSGQGIVLLYRLGDGRYVLRLVDFAVAPTPDLELQLDSAHEIVGDPTVDSTTRANLAGLVATSGSMNYEVPAGIDVSRFHSLLVWCPRLHSVYAAAVLERT